jgi:hypothetical protein
LVALVAPFLYSGVASAASPSVDDVKVFHNYIEPNDWLITCVYNLSFPASCDYYVYPWYIQFIDENNNNSVVSEHPINLCGMRPESIYLNAISASPYVEQGNYSVRIEGRFGTPPYLNASRHINSSDWQGSNLVKLDRWVIYQANILGVNDNMSKYTYTVVTQGYGEILTETGGTIFESGIPGLSFIRPNIFVLSINTVSPDWTPNNNNTSYVDNLSANWYTIIGSGVGDIFVDTGFYFGINGRIIGGIMCFIGFIALCVGASLKSDMSIPFMVIIAGVVVGLIPMALLIVIVCLLLFVALRAFFLTST